MVPTPLEVCIRLRVPGRCRWGSSVNPLAYTVCMTHAVPTRFSARQMRTLDRLVEQGVGETRSDVIRSAVDHLAVSVERARAGQAIAASYRTRPQCAEEDAMAMANAVAMIEAEPW